MRRMALGRLYVWQRALIGGERMGKGPGDVVSLYLDHENPLGD
jgi:hypothetical protein